MRHTFNLAGNIFVEFFVAINDPRLPGGSCCRV